MRRTVHRLIGCSTELLSSIWKRPVSFQSGRLFSKSATQVAVEVGDQASGTAEHICYSYARALQDCSARGILEEAWALHCRATKEPGCMDLFAYNVLLQAYVKLAPLEDAFRLLDEMPCRNTVSYVTLIQGCVQQGWLSEAIQLFCRIQADGCLINSFVLTTIIKVFVSLDVPDISQCVYSCSLKLGLAYDAHVGAALLDAYSLCGLVDDASAVFNEILGRDLICYSAMLDCYVKNGYSEAALELFSEMRQKGFTINSFIFCRLFKASANMSNLLFGKSLHACAIKTFCAPDPYLTGAILDMYAVCGDIQDARMAFDSLSHHNSELCSFMIARYAQANCNKEALDMFCRMRRASLDPTEFCFSSILQSCANMVCQSTGEQVHCHIMKSGFDSDIFLVNALMDVYAKCGKVGESIQLFSGLAQKDEISWNTIIVGYSQLGYWEDALHVFREMLVNQVQGTKVTYSSVLRACAYLSSLDWVSQVHSLVAKTVFYHDTIVCNALIDAYAKSGCIRKARNIFDSINRPDEVSWNAIISGYSLHGIGMASVALFHKMCEAGMQPDKVTFVGVLSACSNVGLVDHGKMFFSSMIKVYGIQPTMEHYSCMVRLLGRRGQLEEAWRFIQQIPEEPHPVVWRSLLSACLVHKNTKLGSITANKVLQMESCDDSTHILLANLYAITGNWESVAAVRISGRSKGVQKEPGISWIECRGEVHSFSSGGSSHPDMRVIYAVLEWLRKRLMKAGYILHGDAVLHAVQGEELERLLWMHSERLALAYGLVILPPVKPICIIKNLRFCADCHATFKIVSEVVKREIIVRDLNRFHHFSGGTCSCCDYW